MSSHYYSQSFIKPHFAGQRLTDPVNERLRFVSFSWLSTRHFQLHHNTGLVLKCFDTNIIIITPGLHHYECKAPLATSSQNLQRCANVQVRFNRQCTKVNRSFCISPTKK